MPINCRYLYHYCHSIIRFSTSVSQSRTTLAVTRDQWFRTDEKIMAYIMRLVFIPIRLSISRSTSSRKQWLALSRMFVQTGAAREYQLCQALQEAKQEDRLHLGILLSTFKILGGTADHGCFLSRLHVCLCSQIP